MAQILKYNQGGPTSGKLIFDGNEMPITKELIDRYKIFGKSFRNDEKHVFTTFMDALNNGLTDPNINIEIDSTSNTISGIDWDGPDRNIKALSRNQSTTGEIITDIFRPKVKAIKKTVYDISNFDPRITNTKYNRWNASDEIILNHVYDEKTGKIDRSRFIDGAPEAEARALLNLFKNVDTLDSMDVILGYDGIDRQDVSKKVKSITDFDELVKRLFDGTYSEEDEKIANYFGIFFDKGTEESRSKLTEQYEIDTAYENAGIPPGMNTYITSDWTFTDEGREWLSQQNWYDPTKNYWLNKDFFELYPDYKYLYNNKNGFFIINGQIYNADKDISDPAAKAIFDAWVKERKENNGSSDRIIHNWGNITDTELSNKFISPLSYYYDKFFGAHVPYMTNESGYTIYRYIPEDKTFDKYGTPDYKYIGIGPNGEHIDVETPLYTTNRTDALSGKEYEVYNGVAYYELGEDKNGITWFKFSNVTTPYGVDKNGNIYTNMSSPIKVTYDNQLWAAKMYFNSISDKTKIKFYQSGGKVQGEDLISRFPIDFATGIGAYVLSNIDTERYFDKIHESFKKQALGQIPVKPSTIYKRFSDHGLTQNHNIAKQKILNSNVNLSSDHVANNQMTLMKNIYLNQKDLEYNSDFSKLQSDFINDNFAIQQNEAKENAAREETIRKIYSSIDAHASQTAANSIKQKGDNLQALIKEMREKRNLEITRRSGIEDKMLQYKIKQTYDIQLNQLINEEPYKTKWAEKHAQYNDDFSAFITAEYPEVSDSIMTKAIGQYYELIINDPNRAHFPMGRWLFPRGTTPQNQIPTVNDQTPTDYVPESNKKGGKLNYIKELKKFDRRDNTLINIFSKL